MHYVSDTTCWEYGAEESPQSDGNYKITRMEPVTSKILECEVTMRKKAFKFCLPRV